MDQRSTTSNAQRENPHKIALVNDSEDTGNKAVKIKLEDILKLTKLAKGGEHLSFDGTLEKGYCIYENANK